MTRVTEHTRREGEGRCARGFCLVDSQRRILPGHVYRQAVHVACDYRDKSFEIVHVHTACVHPSERELWVPGEYR